MPAVRTDGRLSVQIMAEQNGAPRMQRAESTAENADQCLFPTGPSGQTVLPYTSFSTCASPV